MSGSKLCRWSYNMQRETINWVLQSLLKGVLGENDTSAGLLLQFLHDLNENKKSLSVALKKSVKYVTA